MATKFTLAEADKYEGARGPARRILASHDGLVAAKIEDISEKRAAKSNNLMLVWRLVTVDDDAGMNGVVLFSNIVVEGENSRGEANVRQLYPWMEAAGSTKQQIIASLNKSVDMDDMRKTYLDRICYVQIRAETYNGKESSKVVRPLTKDIYEQEAKAGNHRQNHSYGTGAASALAPSNGAAVAVSAPAAAAPASSNDLSL